MIEFKHIVKSFGDHKVLKDISFQIPEGQIFFILGTSGTGKSVLLKNLVGLMRPDSGEIWIHGEEVSRYTEAQYLSVRKNCGIVFQNPALFDSLTIYENVAFGLRRHFHWSEGEVAKRVRKSLNAVHLTESWIEKKLPTEISYGMQKRASLARTLALEPKTLLFDEPTTGLDPVTTQAVNSLIRDLSRSYKTTSIVVSHDMHCALSIADQIIVLDQGEILDQGTPNQLRRSKVPLVQDFLAEVIDDQKLAG